MREKLKSFDQLKEAALNKFGIKTIFPYQLLVISNILDAEYSFEDEKIEKLEKSCKTRKNQIVLFPTGAGKSLCFWLPSLFLEKPTLVIYPLLALMRDQYNKMKASLDTVIFIGGQTKEEREKEYKKLPNANLIIANPEVLANKEILEKIKSLSISHLAIDEAHCVSEWGESFRPSYLTISTIIEELNPRIVTAFTATASPPLLEKMKNLIFKGDVNIISSSLDRPNLIFFLIHCVVKEPMLLEEVEKREKPIVVFCSSRKRTENICRLISMNFPNIEAKFYHAGLEKDEKEEVEAWFSNARNACLVATCAWGMGVDKKDVRTVIHFDVPCTVESYVQEAGRGGRDRKKAEAIVLWSEEDKKRLSQMEGDMKERAKAMISFAESGKCRRHVLLEALSFGLDKKEMPKCAGCDICNGDFLPYSKEVLSICSYVGNKKIIRDDLLEKINLISRYWNFHYSKKLLFFLEHNGFLCEDRFLWKGKLKNTKLSKITLKVKDDIKKLNIISCNQGDHLLM